MKHPVIHLSVCPKYISLIPFQLLEEKFLKFDNNLAKKLCTTLKMISLHPNELYILFRNEIVLTIVVYIISCNAACNFS